MTIPGAFLLFFGITVHVHTLSVIMPVQVGHGLLHIRPGVLDKIRVVVPLDKSEPLFGAACDVLDLGVPVKNNQINAAALCKVLHHFCGHAEALEVLAVERLGVLEFSQEACSCARICSGCCFNSTAT